MEHEYSVLLRLPNDGQKVLCYGHKTYCCKEDMDEEAEWYEVIFKFVVSGYRMKKSLPEDPEESILDFCRCVEDWKPINHKGETIIGVTKWKYIPKIEE